MPRVRSCLAWLLTGSLLLVAALVYPQTVPHATHHSHHNAATHASVLCAWLCAAGQGLESSTAVLPSRLCIETVVHWRIPDLPATSSVFRITSRGPPTLA